MVASEEKIRGLPKSVGFILWKTLISVENLKVIHPIFVDIFSKFLKPMIQI